MALPQNATIDLYWRTQAISKYIISSENLLLLLHNPFNLVPFLVMLMDLQCLSVMFFFQSATLGLVKHTMANRQKLGLASLVLFGKTTLKGKTYVEYTKYSLFRYRRLYFWNLRTEITHFNFTFWLKNKAIGMVLDNCLGFTAIQNN